MGRGRSTISGTLHSARQPNRLADSSQALSIEGADDIQFTVRPGHFDDEAREACTLGHCHSLALALHRRFGWPMVAVMDDKGPMHIAVRLPDERILDAEGCFFDESHFLSTYGTSYQRDLSLRPIDEEEVLALPDAEDWRVPRVELAATWIEELLAATHPSMTLPDA